MPRDLTNKVMIITGASSGIGEATAIACAKAGMDVVINARREDRLLNLGRRIQEMGRQAEIVAGDVVAPGMSQRMLDAAINRFGRFDCVFANAGYGFERAVHEISNEDLRAIFEVNFFAGVDLLRAAANRLIQTKRPGHLLMCSSCLAKFALPYAAPYCATKAAQNQICRAMRIELRPHNIEVSSVHPIGTETEFFEASARRSGKRGNGDLMMNQTPRMFMQPPERVANAIVRCLRRPRSEVWTSLFVRLGAALMVVWPGLNDIAMRGKWTTPHQRQS